MIETLKIVSICLAGAGLGLLSLFSVALFHRAFVRQKLLVLVAVVGCIALWTLSSPQNGSLFISLLRLATLIYVVATVFVLLFSELNNRLIVWFRLLFKPKRFDTHIFWCDSSVGLQLANSICGNKRGLLSSTKIAFIVPSKRAALLSARNDAAIVQVSKAGFLWLFGSDANYERLARAGHHYFTGEDSLNNVLAATKLIHAVYKSGKCHKTKVYIGIETMANNDLISRWADSVNNCKTPSKVEVVLLQKVSLLSKKLLLEHPMLSSPGIEIDQTTATVNGDFSILLIGFGSQGKVLLNDMVCDTQCIDHNGDRIKISVDIVDRDETSFGWFAANCKAACERFGLSFIQSDINSQQFYEWLDDKIETRAYNRIVVCTGSDALNISSAQDIIRRYRMHGKHLENVIFVRVRSPQVRNWLDAAYGTGVFHVFGDESLGSVLKALDQWNRGAMMLNWEYSCNRTETPETVWLNTPFTNKESSRAAFFGMRNMLRLVGYEICEQADSDGCSVIKEAGVLETLSKTEHLRWMAYLMMRGVSAWKPNRETLIAMSKEREGRITPNAIQLFNKHAALVEYDELPKVDALFKDVAKPSEKTTAPSLQQRDRIFIETAVVAIHKAGLSIRRSNREHQ